MLWYTPYPSNLETQMFFPLLMILNLITWSRLWSPDCSVVKVLFLFVIKWSMARDAETTSCSSVNFIQCHLLMISAPIIYYISGWIISDFLILSFFLHYACLIFWVMSNFLWPHGLQPASLLCPWDFPGKNTTVGCHFLLHFYTIDSDI